MGCSLIVRFYTTWDNNLVYKAVWTFDPVTYHFHPLTPWPTLSSDLSWDCWLSERDSFWFSRDFRSDSSHDRRSFSFLISSSSSLILDVFWTTVPSSCPIWTTKRKKEMLIVGKQYKNLNNSDTQNSHWMTFQYTEQWCLVSATHRTLCSFVTLLNILYSIP